MHKYKNFHPPIFNRVLVDKPPRLRLIVPEEVVMQPRLAVGVLVLQAEGLICAIRYLGFLFQTTPAGVVAEPQQIAVLVGHFSWDADLVAVEVVGLLVAFAVFGCPIADLRERFVAIVLPSPQPSPTGEGVDVGMEKSSSNTSLICINPNKSLNYLIPSTLPKNKEKAKKSFPIFFLLNFLTP